MDRPPVDGPLGELLAGPLDDLAVGAVHGRVLAADGALALACFADPGGARALHRALRPALEAALLALLSAPPGASDPEALPRAIRLALFAPVEGDLAAAVRAFALAPCGGGSPAWRTTLAHFRGEAQRVAVSIPDAPIATFEARASLSPALLDLERRLAAATGEERWGEQPGVPARRLLAAIGRSEEPSLQLLRAVERGLVSTERSVVRMLPPLVFQAAADLVAAVACLAFAVPIEWAMFDPEAGGPPPPPLVRARLPGGTVHVPIGLLMLRWWVMPLLPGEEAASLADWVEHQFGRG